MKILIVGPHKSPIIKRLAKVLKDNEHTVWIASHNADGCSEIINLGKINNYSEYFKFGKINKIVKDFNPDVVHAHVLNHYGLMSIGQKKPLVVALWGSDVMLATKQGGFIRKLIFKIINSIVLRLADQCHTSGHHVAEEANRQYKRALQKTKVFYWGLPLEKPKFELIQKIKSDLEKEFNIKSVRSYVVFPRGLGSIYNPELVGRIINELKTKLENPRQIVVLNAFSDTSDIEMFGRMSSLKEITHINRILTAEEMYYLYSLTVAHISVPLSDSLGGGVVEPALLGSYPILSNLPSYRSYALEYPAYIISGETDEDVKEAVKIIISKLNNSNFEKIPKDFAGGEIIKKIEFLYNDAINIRANKIKK